MTNTIKKFIEANTSLVRSIGVAISLMLAVLMYIEGSQLLRTNARNEFEKQTNDAIRQIEINFDKYYIVLRGLKAFVITNPELKPKDFRVYIDSLNIVKNYPGFDALNYAKHFDIEESAVEIKKLKEQMTEYLYDNPPLLKNVLSSIDTNLQSFGDKKEAFVITLDEPIERNYLYIGKNLSSSPAPYKVLMESLTTHKISQSGRLLVSAKDDGSLYWALPFRTPVIANNKYLGSVGAAVDYGEIVKECIKNAQIHYKIYDNRNGKKVLILDSLEFKKSLENNGKGIESINSDITVSDGFINHGKFKVNEKEFDISFYVTDSSIFFTRSNKYFLLLICLLVTLVFLSLWILFINLFSEKNKALGLANNMTKDLQKMAWFDSLTSLHNRAYLINCLESDIHQYPDRIFTLYFIDLNGFKRVNDILGHQAGDKVLKQYADRLIDIFGKHRNTQLSRIGGDEFIVIVKNNDNFDYWVSEIEKATLGTFELDNHKFNLSQSIGIAQYPKDGDNADTLLRKADIAMYAAKTSENENFIIYNHALGEEMIERNKMENNLMEAIKNKELYLVYQPKIKYSNNEYKIAGFEALMRWKSPIWGEVSPLIFIAIAEKNGFIDEISRWLIKETCTKIKYLNNLGITVPISINLSGKQFTNHSIAEEFLYLIKQQGINLEQLLLEITESTIMKQPETAKKIIELYRKNNLKISLDDFGTGYSSFAYLSQFIVDEIKIDRSFIKNITKKENDKALVEAIILMAHKLKLRVVAEGVENIEQLEYLRSINCDNFQGYYFNKPLLLEEIVANKEKFQ